MPRSKRSLVNAGMYHIMIRGVNKQNIFNDNKDKQMFKRLLWYYKNKMNCKIYAYCLMNNHVHILFEDKEFLVSDFMRNITSIYANEFNQKYKRIGHLFQDRFKSIYVYNEEYLLRLIRYIHRNPEKAGICKAEEYKWSSYKEYIYKENIIEKDSILEKFDSNKQVAIKKFKEFIANNKEEDLDRIYVAENLKDEEAIILIKSVIKIENIELIKKFGKEKRKLIIEQILKIENINTNQVARILEISKNFKDRMRKKGSDPFFPKKDNL